MSQEKTHFGQPSVGQVKDLTGHNEFYTRVLGWVAVAMLACGVGAGLVGPLVPDSLMIPLYFVALIALIAASFSRSLMKPAVSNTFAVAIPAILGVILYPTLNYYVGTGQGDIVYSAALGTAIVFGTMAVWGWVSKKNLDSWLPALFFITLGVIGASLLNAFVFQLVGLSLVISIGVVVIFSIYTFIDIQLIKRRAMGDAPASFYALNLFLDIYNIFVALLRIIGIARS